MKTVIDDYKNPNGEHCGSTAMRNLIKHYCDLDLSEAEVVGLGSGTDFIYLKSERGDPAILTFGRSRTLEVDLASALGIDYRETPDLDNDHAWEVVKQEVLEGRPTMLSGDTFYLDYGGFGRHHFPAHRFVLVGYDDEKQKALVADRKREAFEETDYTALRNSRNPRFPTSTYNLWGKFHSDEVKNSFGDACGIAVRRTVDRMLNRDPGPLNLLKFVTGSYGAEVWTGMQALQAFRDDFVSWRERPDWQQITRYSANCFEYYGTGGGNFRRLYTDFLRSAQEALPHIVDDEAIILANTCADAWNTLSQSLIETVEYDIWQQSQDSLNKVYDMEFKLYQYLDERLASNV